MLVCWFRKTSDFHARNNAKSLRRAQTAPHPPAARAMPRHAATSQPPSRRAPAQRRHRRCRWPPWPESTAASSWRPLNSAGRAAAEHSEEDGGQHLVCGNEGHEDAAASGHGAFLAEPSSLMCSGVSAASILADLVLAARHRRGDGFRQPAPRPCVRATVPMAHGKLLSITCLAASPRATLRLSAVVGLRSRRRRT